MGIVALLLAATGCKGPVNEPTSVIEATAMNNEEVVIKLGEPGPVFAKRYANKVRLKREPAGLDFYDISWNPPGGVVRVEHGVHSLVMPHVLGVHTAQDMQELRNEGLFNFSINTGITAPELIPHDETRLKTYEILRGVLHAGWKTITPRSDPRMAGRARFEYAMSVDDTIGLDVSYLPTLDEWMRIESRTPWSFYADGVFMDVMFTRERTLTDPAKPGAYMLTFEIKTATEYYRGFAGPHDRLRWKELLSKALQDVAAQRAKKEAELRAKGVAIDESYQDPPVPSLN